MESSAADSSHVVAELIGRYLKKKKSLNAISLNENISTITALSNDFNYKYVFSRQLEGLGKEEMYYLQFQHQVKVKIF